MTANLVRQLQHDFSDDVVAKLASFLGETPAKTQNAIGYAIPAVLGGLFQKAQTPQGASDILSTLQRGGYDGRSFGNIASLLRSGPSDLVKTGGNLLTWLFGSRQGNLTESMAATSGIGKQASTSLLALAASYIAGVVGKEASATGGFNATSLMNLVGGQGQYLAGVVPSGLAQMLGVLSWGSAPAEPARSYERAQPAPAQAYEPEEKRRGLGWLWVLPLLLLPLLFWAWRGSRPGEPVRPADRTTASTPGPLKPLPAVAPVLVKRKLSCGQELEMAPNGVEASLIGFLDDKSRRVDDTTWFTFDRLEFDTASATLMPGSQPQIRNIAAIMNCYPGLHVKIGGYTDNVGDPASNLRLSQSRAENTASAITASGIAASRLEAEGFGDQHPVATNDTADGRQRNRRIDVRVTQK